MSHWGYASMPSVSTATATATASCLNNNISTTFKILGDRFIFKPFTLRPPVIVSQRRAQVLDDNQKELGGGLGHAVLNALQSSKTPIERIAVEVRTDDHTSNTGERKSRQQQLQQRGEEVRGSDILLAIERASFQRKIEKKKKTLKLKLKLKKEKVDDIGDQKDDEEDEDCSNVGTLNIRSDWSSRLVELESRLQDLVNASSSSSK